jgi:transcriptional regulator with XRE-family HTH domain
MSEFATRLRMLRLASGLSQSQLAARAGHKQPWLAYMESGQREPQLRTVETLAAALGTEVAELLGHEQPAVEGTTGPEDEMRTRRRTSGQKSRRG